MLVKILSVDRRNMIASCCKASDASGTPKFFVSWKSRRFTPKAGDSYSCMPVHEFVTRGEGCELVHGFLHEQKSMEDKLNDNKFRKK